MLPFGNPMFFLYRSLLSIAVRIYYFYCNKSNETAAVYTSSAYAQKLRCPGYCIRYAFCACVNINVFASAWKPVLPTVTFPILWSSPRVSFEKATNYSIQSYDIRLNKHDYLNGVIVTVASVTVDATFVSIRKLFCTLDHFLMDD